MGTAAVLYFSSTRNTSQVAGHLLSSIDALFALGASRIYSYAYEVVS